MHFDFRRCYSSHPSFIQQVLFDCERYHWFFLHYIPFFIRVFHSRFSIPHRAIISMLTVFTFGNRLKCYKMNNRLPNGSLIYWFDFFSAYMNGRYRSIFLSETNWKSNTAIYFINSWQKSTVFIEQCKSIM